MIRFELIRLCRSRASRNLILLFMLASFIIFLAGYTSIFSNNFSWQSYRDMADNMTIRSADESCRKVKSVLEDFYNTGKIHQGVYTDNISKELKLYREIECELEQVCSYENYRKNIIDDAKKVQSVSLFQKSEASVANAGKTFRDYEALGDIEVSFSKTYGVKRLFQNQDMLICILFIIIILIDLLYLRDIEENRTILLHTVIGGRKQLGIAKAWLGALLTVISYTMMLAARIITIAITYGIPKVSIQSVQGYNSCIFRIDTYEAIGLFAIYQLLSILALYMLGIFLALLVKNNYILYFICLAFGILSEILYRVIDPYSNLAVLHRCNIFYLLNPQEALFRYRNVEIGGRVFSGWIVNVSFAIFILLAAGFMDYLLYKNVVKAKQGQNRSDISYYAERLWHRILGRTSLLGAELRKCFLYSKGILIVFSLVLMIAYIYKPASTRLYTDEEIYYKQYVTRLQGRYSREKMNYLYDELMVAETDKEAGIEKTIRYGQYLEDKSGAEFVYDRGYMILMGLDSGKNVFFEYRILSILFSVILTLVILDIDEKTKMRRLIIPTATGFRKMVLAKRQAVFISCLLVFAIVYIPWILSVLVSYRDISWSVGAASIQGLAWCGQIPVGLVIALFFLLHLLGLILISRLTEILYRRLGKVIPAASISCIVGMGICLILRG